MEGFRRKERGFDGGSGSGGNGGGGEEFGECKRGCHFGGANNGSEDSETEVKRKLSVSLLAVFVSRVRYSQVYEDDNKSISVLSSYHIYFILS